MHRYYQMIFFTSKSENSVFRNVHQVRLVGGIESKNQRVGRTTHSLILGKCIFALKLKDLVGKLQA